MHHFSLILILLTLNAAILRHIFPTGWYPGQQQSYQYNLNDTKTGQCASDADRNIRQNQGVQGLIGTI